MPTYQPATESDARISRVHVKMLLALTFTTGVVDAAGFLGLDRVFTANMTGNVVILGMGLTGAEDLPVVGPLLAFVGFVTGAGVGGALTRQTPHRWTTTSTALLSCVGSAILVLGLWAWLLPLPSATALHAITALLGTCMGLQASVARNLAIRDVATVAVTSTVTAFAMNARLAGGTGALGWRRGLSIGLMLIGAGFGALGVLVDVGLSLVGAGAVMLGVALVGQRYGRPAVVSP